MRDPTSTRFDSSQYSDRSSPHHRPPLFTNPADALPPISGWEGEWATDDLALFLQLDSKLRQEGMDESSELGGEGGEQTWAAMLEGMVEEQAGEAVADVGLEGAGWAGRGRHVNPESSPTWSSTRAPVHHSVPFHPVLGRRSPSGSVPAHQAVDGSTPLASRAHSPLFDARSPASSRSSSAVTNKYTESATTYGYARRPSVTFATHTQLTPPLSTRPLTRPRTSTGHLGQSPRFLSSRPVGAC